MWFYTPDLSRRWGEMEAYKTMIWVQPPGTTSMGHLFLDAYHATGDRYYLDAADKAARAIIWGQLPVRRLELHRRLRRRPVAAAAGTTRSARTGGGSRSSSTTTATRRSTTTCPSDAAKFLLRMYLEELNPAYKPALDKAIDFVLESQYPIGGWPQRFPLKYDFSHHGKPDYTSFITFNDDVVWENVNFLLQCYLTLGEERLLEPIVRGMNIYVATQQGAPQAGWGQQYTLDLKPSGARTYEPTALLPGYTEAHIRLSAALLPAHRRRKFLAGIPAALDWLDRCKLPRP